MPLSRDHAPCGSGDQGVCVSDSVSRPCSVRIRGCVCECLCFATMLRAGLAVRVCVCECMTLSRDHAPCGSGGQSVCV